MREQEFSYMKHSTIMEKVLFYKYRFPLLTAMALLSINLAYSTWKLFSQIIEMESVSIIRTMLEDFEFSFDYLSNFFEVISINIPVYPFLHFSANIFLFGFAVYLFKHFKKSANLIS